VPGLREIAEADLSATLEDSEMGWGVSMTITNPVGRKEDVVGQSGDIHFLIDPDTGQAVSGRVAHVSLRLATLADLGLGVPEAIADDAGDPWVITFQEQNFIVEEARPDRTLGIITILLEAYDT